MSDKITRNRCSKILSLVASTSSSQQSNSSTTYNELTSASTSKNSTPLDDTDHHNSSTSDLDFNSDDSLFDENYVPSSLEQSVCSTNSDISTINSIPNSQSVNVTIPESPEILSEEDAPSSLTKRGTNRKRKMYSESKAQRKALKKLKDMVTKYKLKPGCNIKTCKKKCHTNFTENTRKEINQYYRNLAWREQKVFLISNTSKEEPKRNTVKQNRKRARDLTISYFLTNEAGKKINVCKVFFLETLGFNKKNDKSVRNALSTQYTVPNDKRGFNPNPNKLDDTVVVNHINSFFPSISHHRREHAPNRKYLPSDITVTKMYQDFCEQELLADKQISYDYYRKIVKKLNISFTKLGHEECDVCAKYFIHNPDHREKRHRNCTDCRDYEKHYEKYRTARQEYRKDVEIQNNANITSDTLYVAADLEKVIMLPRIDEFKIVMFCPRIIVLNESFVPIGDKKNNAFFKTYAAIWHEATSGRKMIDILSCFRAFLLANRDLKHVVIWLDNCASQNKNWTLLSFLVYLVNSSEVSFLTITLKYLEAGHTHMAADEFHHQVELAMKKKKHIYDFEDFNQAVLSTRTNLNVKVMNLEDFFYFEDCSSSYKLQNTSPRAYLGDMCQIMFEKGTHTVRYKTDFLNEEVFTLDFLRLKNIKSGIPPPKQKKEYRGINPERKSAIIHKLTPLMPDNRKLFWYNLPVDKNSVDLTQDYEE